MFNGDFRNFTLRTRHFAWRGVMLRSLRPMFDANLGDKVNSFIVLTWVKVD